MQVEVRGRHLISGLPTRVMVNDGEIREALSATVDTVVHSVRDALERIPPELAADIYDHGVVITGGGSMLHSLAERLRKDTELPVQMAEDPLTSVVRGAGRMLSNFSLLKKLASLMAN